MVIGRRHLKTLYFTGLHLMGAQARLLGRLRGRDEVVILNLHRVSPRQSPFWNPMHPKLFEELLKFLTRHFHVTSFKDCDLENVDKPKVILSFDDGYYDFIEYAVPLLRKYQVPANQNIIPACVESGLAPWTVQVTDTLSAAPRHLINEMHLEGFSQQLPSDRFDDKVAYGVSVSRFLTERSQQDRQALWTDVQTLMAQVNGKVQHTRMMNVQEIKQIARDYEIGAHSYSHESMEWESNEFFKEDFQKCRAFFSDTLNIPLRIYAFPNGSYREEQISILREEGVERVLLVEEQFAKPRAAVCPRFTMHGDSSAEIRFRAMGFSTRRAA